MRGLLIKRFQELSGGEGFRAQLVRSALGIAVLKILALLLSLLLSVILARALGPSGFGQYAFVIALVSVLSIPLGPAITQFVTRETAAIHKVGDWGQVLGLHRWCQRWALLGALVLAVGLGLIASANATWQADDRWTALLIGAVTLPFVALSALRSGVLAGLRWLVFARVPELVVRPAVQVSISLLILLPGLLNPATAVAAHAAAAAIAFLIGAKLLTRVTPSGVGKVGSGENHAGQLSAWIPFTFIAAGSVLNAQVGLLLLGWLGTAEHVAAFQLATRGAQLVAVSLVVVNMVIGPYVTQAYRDGDSPRLRMLWRRSARAALTFSVPVAIPMIAFGELIIQAVFGAEYVSLATVPLAILSVAQLVNVASGSVGLLLVMSGHERDTLVGQGIALVMNVVVAMLLIPESGANGAALAAMLGTVTWNGLLTIQVLRRLSIQPRSI